MDRLESLIFHPKLHYSCCMLDQFLVQLKEDGKPSNRGDLKLSFYITKVLLRKTLKIRSFFHYDFRNLNREMLSMTGGCCEKVQKVQRHQNEQQRGPRQHTYTYFYILLHTFSHFLNSYTFSYFLNF